LRKFNLTVFKTAVIAMTVLLVTLGVIWGGAENALYTFEGNNLHAFLSVNSWQEANFNLNVDAKGWQDTAVEGNVSLKVFKDGLRAATYSFNGSQWVESDGEENFDYKISALKSGTITFPSVTTLPEANQVQHIYIKACLRLRGDQGSPEPEKCAQRAYSKIQLTKNAAQNQETLRSNSVSISTAMAIGVADYYPSQKPQKISFEVKLSAPTDVVESFSLFPDYTGKLLDFSKIKINVSANTNPAMPIISVVNGVIKQNLLFSMGKENLKMPAELSANLKQLKDHMKLTGKTPEELLTLFKSNGMDSLVNGLDDSLLEETIDMNREWEQQLVTVVNAGFGDTKANGVKWISGIWKPMDTSYRIEVEVSPGAPEFRLYALMTPFSPVPPQMMMGINWPGSFDLTSAMKKLDAEFSFPRPQPFALRNKNMLGTLPENIDDVPPECRAMMESFGIKLYTSLTFNGLAGGVVGKLVGGVGSLFGATAQGIESAGTLAGWISGGVFDALSPIDRAKFWISFFASSAMLKEPKAITFQLVNTVTRGGDYNICINKPFQLRTGWYNQCNQRILGHNSQQFARLEISPSGRAKSAVLGPDTGAKGLVGSGAVFAIEGVQPGPATLRVYVHDKEHYRDLDVNFVNCNSPLAKPNSPK